MAELKAFEQRHTFIRRHLCTPEDPWNGAKGKYAIHPHAKMDSELHPGSIWMKCPICGQRFQEITIKKE